MLKNIAFTFLLIILLFGCAAPKSKAVVLDIPAFKLVITDRAGVGAAAAYYGVPGSRAVWVETSRMMYVPDEVPVFCNNDVLHELKHASGDLLGETPR